MDILAIKFALLYWSIDLAFKLLIEEIKSSEACNRSIYSDGLSLGQNGGGEGESLSSLIAPIFLVRMQTRKHMKKTDTTQLLTTSNFIAKERKFC